MLVQHKWGYPCRIVNPTRHMTKDDARAGGEAPTAGKKDPSLSKPKIDQGGPSRANMLFTCVGSNMPQDKQDPSTIANTACIDAVLPNSK